MKLRYLFYFLAFIARFFTQHDRHDDDDPHAIMRQQSNENEEKNFWETDELPTFFTQVAVDDMTLSAH